MSDKKSFAELAAAAKVHNSATCTVEPCRRCSGPHKPDAPHPRRHDARSPVEAPDPVVRSIGLPRHPAPSTIADALEAAAKILRTSGLNAIGMASVLASRGFAASTLGDGGSRSTDSTSMPERSAWRPGQRSDDGNPIPPPPESRWWAADHHYARTLADLWRFAIHTKATTEEIVRHASDVDPTPAGTGECKACARFCRPTEARPSHRLRSGLCPSCYGAWRTYQADGGTEMWSAWTSKRRESFTERDANGTLIAIHTPEEHGQSA